MKGGKVKNPCKICCESVTNKNGIQCQGACKKWTHFKCLDYTPGKICDIKAGLIKITCPCPDCKEAESKESLQHNKEACPASKPRKCEAADCPHKHNPIPPFPPVSSIPPPPAPAPPRQPQHGNTPCSPAAPKNPTAPNAPHPPSNIAQQQKCPPPKKTCTDSPKNKSSPKCSAVKKSSSSSVEKADARATCHSCPAHCPKNSNPQVKKDKKPISPQRSQSCDFNVCPSCISATQNAEPKGEVARCCSSDSALLSEQDKKALYNAVEQMCDTVGQLSNQLKDLMTNMVTAFEKERSNQ